MRFSLFCLCAWRVVKRERGPTREERARIRERIAAADSVRAWLLAGKPNPHEVRARKAKLNALADKYGMARSYSEVDGPPEET